MSSLSFNSPNYPTKCVTLLPHFIDEGTEAPTGKENFSKVTEVGSQKPESEPRSNSRAHTLRCFVIPPHISTGSIYPPRPLTLIHCYGPHHSQHRAQWRDEESCSRMAEAESGFGSELPGLLRLGIFNV